MKKILFTSIVLILLLFPIVSKAVATNSSYYDGVKIYVFYEENSENFEQEKQWLEEDASIMKTYLNINENSELLSKVKDALKIGGNKLPITIIGSTYFIGFDEKVQNNMKEAVEAYKNVEEYGDIIEKIRNNEDAKDVIKQNEEIYKQPGKFNTVFNIILIIVVVCVVILVIVKSLKKKKTSTKSHH